MQDANDNIVYTKKAQVLGNDSVPANTVLNDTSMVERVNQQKILPTSVTTRAFGNLFSSEPDSDALGTGIVASIQVPASTTGSFNFTCSDTNGRQIFAVADISFYIDVINPSSPTSLWPNQTYGMGIMPISVYNSWALTDNSNVVVQANLRNNDVSVPFHLIFCVCRFRIIANPGQSGFESVSPTGQTDAFGGKGGGGS